ncbi:hypothetical protein [Kitasatospora sp. LaBMicrA B282]|uniref:hypothetical protein n=1 Tax=Kitasatospora sp. LaBMicrA B282 TaxID=3420949 RepID=UPI003D12F495
MAASVLGGPAAGLAVVAFGLLMLLLAAIGWDGTSGLPNLTQTAPALVTALLGAVINPDHTVSRRTWNGLAAAALVAACSAGLAVVVFPRHVDALPALTASVAAFAGLYVNTSKVTHTGAA